jgi:hypothetical protein
MVVDGTDTIVQPLAVVIEHINTFVAEPAVLAASVTVIFKRQCELSE